MKCLVCKKEVKPITWSNQPLLAGCLVDAGRISISFGYGSKYDALRSQERERDNMSDDCRKASADKILACICDNCFADNLDCIESYDIIHHRDEFVRLA